VVRVTGQSISLAYMTSLVVALVTATGLLATFYRIALRRPGFQRRVWPGAALAVGIGVIASVAFGYYAAHLAQFRLFYGSLAAVAITLGGFGVAVWPSCSVRSSMSCSNGRLRATRRRPTTMKSSPSELVMVGWSERVALPEWGVKRLKAKIDTGARTSAVHVENIRRMRGNRIAFDVVTDSDPEKWIPVVTRPSRRSTVRSSNGHETFRYFVKTQMVLGGIQLDIELSLVDRGDMRFRMLIGRTALAGQFIVNCAHRMITHKPKSARLSQPAGGNPK